MPKSLAKGEVDRLIRAAEKEGNKRDLAILLTLRHMGLRVGELCNLRLGDVRISERQGTLLVRSGMGDKDRTVPLNNELRQALEAYQKVRSGAAGRDPAHAAPLLRQTCAGRRRGFGDRLAAVGPRAA